MNEVQVLIEFTGVSRMLTGVSELSMKVQAGTTFSDIVGQIAEKFPALVGQVIEKNKRELIGSNLFSLNGQRIIQESEMDGKPANGDRLILISLLAGG